MWEIDGGGGWWEWEAQTVAREVREKDGVNMEWAA